MSFVGIADIALHLGQRDVSDQSVQYAEQVYSEVATYLTDPRVAKCLTNKLRRGIAGSLDNLRKALDILAKRMPKRVAVA